MGTGQNSTTRPQVLVLGIPSARVRKWGHLFLTHSNIDSGSINLEANLSKEKIGNTRITQSRVF